MRLRFTIRDLLWLKLVVALVAAWWIDRQHLISSHDKYRQILPRLIDDHLYPDLLTPTGGRTHEQLEEIYQHRMEEEEEKRQLPAFGVSLSHDGK